MARSPLVGAMAGVWPIASYLHVPKQMPQPVWLSLGTAFALDKASAGFSASFQAKHEVLLLCAAHTMTPWRLYKLNIPDDWCKGRYVIGKALMYDAFGAGDAARLFDVGLVGVHPTLDVALLRVAKPAEFRAACRAGPRGDEGDHNDTFAATRLVPSPTEPTNGTFVGFRGRGSLGDVAAPDEEAVKKMSAAEKQQLQEQHRNAVGRQDATQLNVALVAEPPTVAVPRLRTSEDEGHVDAAASPASSVYSRAVISGVGRGYAGMSGSPLFSGGSLLAPADGVRDAHGLLFQAGLQEARDSEVLYVPSEPITEWLQTLK